MTEERKYIYAIIRNPKVRQLVEQASDTFHLSEAILGINNRDTVFIPYRDIAAIVSNIHLINFDKLDKDELTQFIAAHDQVNAELMKKRDVIPMRFGMIAENREEIRNVLAKAYVQFKAALERIAKKAEFVVQVFWDEHRILDRIVQENPEIQKLKKEVESKGKILGFPSRMKLGKHVFEALESYRKEYTKDILNELAAYFPHFSVGKFLDTAKIGARKADKEIIMNHSFLVGKTEEPILQSLLNKLAEKYDEKLKFKYIGPMAPYSFAAINLGLGNFDLVDNARKVFGFGESVAFPDIKQAYYRLAGEHHPDKHAFAKDQVIVEEAEKKMKDIITANEVLTVYCEHYLSALAPEKKRFCSFKKEDVENSIMVKETQLL